MAFNFTKSDEFERGITENNLAIQWPTGFEPSKRWEMLPAPLKHYLIVRKAEWTEILNI